MPGMNSGLNISDPTVVAAFKSALLHQGLIALLIFAVLGLAWVTVRAWLPAATRDGEAGTAGTPSPALAEPGWRQLLRIGFGLLWIFDGILQAQPKMAIGLPSQVIEPAAANSPAWVQHVVNWAGTTWSYHPMQAGASAVWIQVGIGIWMLAASRGAWSRLAGLVSVGWGLVVWVFGESFGGIFAPGLTWLFGAPGAVLIYCVAGALIALPERTWRTARLGRLVLAGMGLFLAGMAVLQAWPGRGFWQGRLGHGPGTLTDMIQSMAQTPQPRFLAAWVNGFGSFTAAHGFAVNLFVVAALAVTGAVFLSGRPRLIRPVVIAFTVLCLADWVLIEDIGFFGGLGTDPNSMLPMALLAIAGYLALARAPAPAAAAEPASTGAAEPASTGAAAAGWRDRVRPAAVGRSIAGASIQSVASAGAIGLIILGAAPMAAAQASPVADTILARAINGSSAPLDYPAPAFALTDQHGRTVTLAGLRGKVVLLTFLDPVCSSDCPLIAQEFRQAGQLLSADSRQVELVAINYNPLYTQLAYTRAFDRQEHLDGVPNWLYLTGPRARLQQIWHNYALPMAILPAGSMIGHGDYAFVIDRAGHMRRELNFDPGPATASTKSSFAAELTDAARQLLGPS
jgi:cytochrome oxidase Cu insertion factor (SCO1/SenC/PrrC family)